MNFQIFSLIVSASTFLLDGLLWFVLAFLLYNFIRKNFQRDPRLVKFSKTLPGPWSIPFLGSFAHLYYARDPIKAVCDFYKTYGDVYKLWFGKHLVVSLSNVDDFETVFMSTKMLEKPKVAQSLHDIWGDGLFTAPVNIWKKNRKIFLPPFVHNRFDNYAVQINNLTRETVKNMKKLNYSNEFDARDFFIHLSFNIITKTMLNVQLDPDDELIAEFHETLTKAQLLSYRRMSLPWFHVKFIDNWFHETVLNDIKNNISKYTKRVIDEKKKQTNDEVITSHKEKDTSSSAPLKSTILILISFHVTCKYLAGRMKLFIDIAEDLLNQGHDEQIIKDEIFNVTAGGTNTNASVISLFLIAVAIHQDIQSKLYDELYEIFEDSDRDADLEDIKRLQYLDQVLKESLRRFTIAPFLLREVSEDTKIGERIFPAGTTVLLNVLSVHFNSKYYPNPWNFNPDNYCPEVVKRRHKFTFLPFSAASRNCIGKHFAMMEFKLILSTLLRNFSFHTTMKMEDLKFDVGVVLHCSNANLSIKPRIRKPSYQR